MVFEILFSACDNGTTNNGSANSGGDGSANSGGLRTSVQVNNQTNSRSIITGDVELFINELYYPHDEPNSGFIFFISEHGTDGSALINNAGWYSITENLGYRTPPFNGKHSSLILKLSAMKVDGTEYTFSATEEALLGTQVLSGGSPQYNTTVYPGQFDGITITDETVSLKTILIIDSAIIGTPNSQGYDAQGLSINPYQYITAEGRINE
jgi:hypothetical protein